MFCIGDSAIHRDLAGIRIESVQNASHQASVVAKTLCGSPTPYSATPWFWSNQYDIRPQTIGINRGHDAVVLRGDPRDRSFSLLYLKRGAVIAIDCINAAKDYAQGRSLVENCCRVEPALLADASIPLKQLACSNLAAL